MDANLLLKFNLENYSDTIEKLIIYSENNSIFSGKAGSILYLLELYDITQENNVLNKIKEIANSITINYASSYAFFTGNIGIAYTFIRLYKVCSEKKYLYKALQIAKETKNHLAIKENSLINLMNGVSGILLGLLHLYNEGISEDWLIKDIKFYVDYIISKTELGKQSGVFWDKTVDINHGLTGFAHGASGVGFVFYQLYKMTGNEGFKKLCYQTFYYENNNYEYNFNYWLENRKYPNDEDDVNEYIKQIKSENIDFFINKKFMMAWCYGAPGNILSRSYTNFRDDNIEKYLILIINNLTKLSNHSLYNSGVGNALCLLSLKYKNNTQFKKNLIKLCQNILIYFNKNQTFISGYNKKKYCYSLLMGNLGVFYFTLKVFKFFKGKNIGNNILYPIIQRDVYNTIKLSKIFIEYNYQYIACNILSNFYTKTIYLLNRYSIKLPNIDNKSMELSFINFMATIKNPIIKDAFIFEHKIRKVDNKIKSYGYCYLRNWIDKDFISNAGINIKQIKIKLNTDITFISSKWDWNTYTNPKWTLNVNTKPQLLNFIIIPGRKIMIIKSNKFILNLFDFIKNHSVASIKETTDYFTNSLFAKGKSLDEIQKALLFIIKQLVKKGILQIYYEKF